MKLLELRNIAKKYNLRIIRDSDGNYISPTRSRLNPHDHMYDGFSSYYGLAIRRTSKRSFNAVRKQLEEVGLTPIQIGETEGNFKFKESLVPSVAKLFKLTKKATKPPLHQIAA